MSAASIGPAFWVVDCEATTRVAAYLAVLVCPRIGGKDDNENAAPTLPRMPERKTNSCSADAEPSAPNASTALGATRASSKMFATLSRGLPLAV